MRTTAPLVAFKAGHAAMVRRRAPCSLSARPASHSSSVISNRSICGTAPAILRSASMRSNAAWARSTTLLAASGWERSLSMTSAFAPAAFTASAVLSRFARSRATRTSAVKSRARRMAVERPMPWLAPVRIATDFSMRAPPSKQASAGDELADRRRDLCGVRLQSEMPGVEEADGRVGDVAFECLGARRQEKGIVLSPRGQKGRLVGAEILLEGRIERDVALIVAHQVELHLRHAGLRHIETVERVSVRRHSRRIRHAVGILPSRRIWLEKAAQRLPISL